MRTSSHKPAGLLALAIVLAAACNPAQQTHKTELFAFGTIVTLKIYGAGEQQARAAVAALESRYREIDADWYPWPKDPNLKPGALPAVNHALGRGDRADVDPDLAALIRRASELERLSGGRFNPAIGSVIFAWGFHTTEAERRRVPSEEGIAELLRWRLSTEQLEWQGNNLGSRSPFIHLDLGGIAKGAILELSVDLLREHGIDNAIVDIGGDLTVIGDVHGRAAHIGIRSPFVEGETLGWLDVADGETVVTSGNYERYFELDGKRYSHILDPRTGFPVMHTSSVTVVHRDPLLADAAATALVVGGIGEFAQICEAMGITQAMIVGSTGDLRLTGAMEKRVHSANKDSQAADY